MTPIQNAVSDAVAWFTDKNKLGTLANFIWNFQNKGLSYVAGEVGGLVTNIESWFNTNISEPVGAAISNVVGWFTDATQVGSLANFLSNLSQKGFTYLLGAGVDLITTIGNWVATNIGEPIGNALQGVVAWFTDASTEGTLAYTLSNLGTILTSFVGDIGSWIDVNLVEPAMMGLNNLITFLTDTTSPDGLAGKIFTFFNGAGDQPGTLAWLFTQAVSDFAQLPQLIGDALRGLGLWLWNALVTPIINSVNWIIDRLNEFLRTSGDAIRAIIEAFGGHTDAAKAYDLPHISTAPPDWLGGAAKGGMFGAGALKVGEKGTEVVGSASQMAVFPHEFITSVDHLASVLVDFMHAPAPMSAGSGGSSSYDNSINATFNNVPPNQVINRLAMLKAGR